MCGVVPRLTNLDYTNYSCSEKSYEKELIAPRTHTITAENKSIAQKNERKVQQGSRMVENLFRDDVRKRQMMIKLEEFSNLLDIGEKVKNRVSVTLEKDFIKVVSMRGFETTILALLVVYQRMAKLSINVKHVERISGKHNVSKRIKKVVRLLNIRVANLSLSRIEAVCDRLRLSFKKSQLIKDKFLRLKNANQNVGEDTLLAVAILSIEKRTLTVQEVALATGTNAQGIQLYCTNKTRYKLIKNVD